MGKVLKHARTAVAQPERQAKKLDQSRSAGPADKLSQIKEALDYIQQGFCVFDAGRRLIGCNARFREIYSLPERTVEPGTRLQILQAHIAQSSNMRGTEQLPEPMQAPARNMHFLKDGRSIAVFWTPLPTGGLVLTYEDVTDRTRTEAEIAFLAHHDSLTALPNRTQFRERLAHHLHRVRRGDAVAVMCLDLDGFKEVNDTFGHAAGDELLKAVAGRLTDCVRQEDTVARLGGDEFAIIQVGFEQPRGITALAKRLVEAINSPFQIDGNDLRVGLSLGIAIAPNDGDEPDALLKNADVALYRAKHEGRRTFRFFGPEMDARMQDRRKLEQDLRQAIPEKQFEYLYQPIVRSGSREVVAFEGLLRWNHPVRGEVAPESFLPVAEEIGLGMPIGRWAIDQAFTDAARWPDHISLSMNTSAAQVKSPESVQQIASALARFGLAPQRVEIEVTEAVLLKNPEPALATLYALRDLGVRISLSQFGAGCSSMQCVRSFPFSKIKLDRSIVGQLSDTPSALGFAQAVAALGRSLGMSVAACGVETGGQLSRLAELGYTELQGYLIGEPAPAEHFLPIRAGAPLPAASTVAPRTPAPAA